MKEFFKAEIQVVSENEEQETEDRSNKVNFCEFLCYFNICKKKITDEITQSQISNMVNQNLRYSVKQRCVVSTTISNKHLHLLREITLTKTRSRVSRGLNLCINLHTEDITKQAPFLCALR
jgi:hypothetical protein